MAMAAFAETLGVTDRWDPAVVAVTIATATATVTSERMAA